MTGALPLPGSNEPPICPACSKRVFRRGHMVQVMENRDKMKDGVASYTVCMNCSSIWKLMLAHGALKLVALTEDERRNAWPVLGEAVTHFDNNRRYAAYFHMDIEEFLDTIDALPPETRKRLMG